MAFQTYQPCSPLSFDYAAIAALIAPQTKPAETPKPKVSYEYVVRFDKGTYRYSPLPNQDVGTYVTYNLSRFSAAMGFRRSETLETATRFKTANDAAEAIKVRNRNHVDDHQYSIVPVKVTVTPATTSTKTVDEVVPAKTGFVLQDTRDQTYVSAVLESGYFGYTWTGISAAHLFPTAGAAGEAFAKWQRLTESSTGFTILPHTTPVTTKPKTVTETIPASTAVTLA